MTIRKPGNASRRAPERPLWPGSGPSEQAVKRRLRRALGREPNRREIAAATIAASTLNAKQMLARARPGGRT